MLEPGTETSFTLASDRHLWVQALRGTVEVNGHALSAGDGLAASDETEFARERDGYLSAVRAGKELSVDGVDIRDERDLDAVLHRRRRRRSP